MVYPPMALTNQHLKISCIEQNKFWFTLLDKLNKFLMTHNYFYIILQLMKPK